MSDEQWKDFKLKLTAGAILLVLGSAVAAVGPGLPKVLEYTRKNQKEPWAPSWYYRIGRTMEMTFRGEAAQEVYIEFVKLYGNDLETDFGYVLEDDRGTFHEPYYLPWIAEREYWSKGNDWPEAVRKDVDRDLLGKVLERHGRYWELRREYTQFRHILSCLRYMWPEGSEVHQTAETAFIRDIQRSM